MKMTLRACGWAALVAAWSPAASAVMIDSFDSGAISQGPDVVNADLLQPSPSVLGGERKVFAHYGGSLDIGGNNGALLFDHAREFFEVASIEYPGVENADLTQDGHDRIRVKLGGFSSDSTSHQPLTLRLTVFTGVGTGDQAGAAVAVKPFASDDGYFFDLDYDSFTTYDGDPLDFTDVDRIVLSIFAWDFGEFTIEEIATAAPTAPGDYDGSGTVDAADYAVWRQQYGQTGPLSADGNGDGFVDAADYAVWRDGLGATPASAGSPTPEPSALLLGLAASAAGVRLQRKQR